MTAEKLLSKWCPKRYTLEQARCAVIETTEEIDGLKGGLEKSSQGNADDSTVRRISKKEQSLHRWEELFDERQREIRKIDSMLMKLIDAEEGPKETKKTLFIYEVIVMYYRDGVFSDSEVARNLGVHRDTAYNARQEGLKRLDTILEGGRP